MNLVLVGAGGHARAVCEAIRATRHKIVAYVDPRPASWLAGKRFAEDLGAGTLRGCGFALGLGGTAPGALKRRLELFARYRRQGRPAPSLVHPTAHVSPDAVLEEGAIVLARAVVQPGARVGRAAIINTGAMVEHDSTVAEGAHIAPGAIVLGGVTVGACAMIGAGAVLLPAANVAAAALVPALGRFPAARARR